MVNSPGISICTCALILSHGVGVTVTVAVIYLFCKPWGIWGIVWERKTGSKLCCFMLLYKQIDGRSQTKMSGAGKSGSHISYHTRIQDHTGSKPFQSWGQSGASSGPKANILTVICALLSPVASLLAVRGCFDGWSWHYILTLCAAKECWIPLTCYVPHYVGHGGLDSLMSIHYAAYRLEHLASIITVYLIKPQICMSTCHV